MVLSNIILISLKVLFIRIMSTTNHSVRGSFIVIEGLDKSGKSSQCQRILQMFNKANIPAILTGFPDRKTKIGNLLNEYLQFKTTAQDESIHLLFSANRWEKMAWIQNQLENGISVICDRYSYSGVAYAAAKGLNFDWCHLADDQLISPDIIVFIEVPQVTIALNIYI